MLSLPNCFFGIKRWFLEATFKVLPCFATGVAIIDIAVIAVDAQAVLADVDFETESLFTFEQKVNVF